MNLVTLVVVLVAVIIVCLGVIGVLASVCKLYRHEIEPLDPPVKTWADAYWEDLKNEQGR